MTVMEMLCLGFGEVILLLYENYLPSHHVLSCVYVSLNVSCVFFSFNQEFLILTIVIVLSKVSRVFSCFSDIWWPRG